MHTKSVINLPLWIIEVRRIAWDQCPLRNVSWCINAPRIGIWICESDFRLARVYWTIAIKTSYTHRVLQGEASLVDHPVGAEHRQPPGPPQLLGNGEGDVWAGQSLQIHTCVDGRVLEWLQVKGELLSSLGSNSEAVRPAYPRIHHLGRSIENTCSN